MKNIAFIASWGSTDYLLMFAMERDLGNKVLPFVPEQIEDIEGSDCVIISADCVVCDGLVDLCESVQKICGKEIPIILIAREPTDKLFLNPADRLRVKNVIRVDVEEDGVPGDMSRTEKFLEWLKTPRQNMYALFIKTIQEAL